MKADFTEVFNFIFDCLKTVYNFLNSFEISFNNFSFSMWDFFIALLLLSALVPLVSFCNTSGISDAFGYVFNAESERIKTSKELAAAREQERINTEKAMYIRSFLRSREARHNYANSHGLPDGHGVIYGQGSEHKKLK